MGTIKPDGPRIEGGRSQLDRFENMQAFVRVVETGSITGAAQRLGVAKSAVSRRLAELEEHLGAQLFRRTTRRLNLTETGQGFYERCQRLLADLEEAEQAVAQEHATLRGTLRVAVPQSFGLLHLGPAIGAFAAAHPAIAFDLDFNDRQVDLVADGFDVAIRIAALGDSTLIARRLATIRHVVCASPAYLDAHGTPRTPEDLTAGGAHRCLGYSNAAEPAIWRFEEPGGAPRSVRVALAMRANNGDFLCRAAIEGHGLILEPTFIVYRAIERGELVPILTDVAWPSIDAHAVYPQTRHLSQRVRAFVDFLAGRFAGVPYWDRCLARYT